MSKIGKKPIVIPAGVEVKSEKALVSVKGPKGKLSLVIRPEIEVSFQENQLRIERKNDSKLAKSLHGLTRTLIANMILGVTEGFKKSLKIVGTGYRVKLEEEKLILSVGFSHPVKIKPAEGIEFKLKGDNFITISGVDKQLVGQVASKIRQVRPPDAYKGKGIRYQDEVVRKKPGKAAKTGVA